MKGDYKISVRDDDWVTPEETLMDPSGHSNIEHPISNRTLSFLFAGMAVILLAIVASLTPISIADHAQYADLALQNKSVQFAVPPPRGIIYDRNGRALVKNVANFSLLVLTREARESDSFNSDTAKIAEIMRVQPDKFGADVAERMKSNAVFFAAADLNKDQILAIEYLNPKGFYIMADTNRDYFNGPTFAHVVGYTGKVNKEDLASDTYYTPTDMKGRLGLEDQYEEILRGEHGRILLENDGTRRSGTLLNAQTQAGQDLLLNIDAELQEKVYRTLDGILRESGLSRAAAIVQDPRNGAVLALVSFPTFDNNIFQSSISENQYKHLFENRLKPLFNRVTSGLYNPGSTIKPLIGLMALQEKIFTPQDVIRDCVNITFPNPSDPSKPYVFGNWRTEYGLFNLRKAIANSCNIYFFIAGGGFGDVVGLGVTKIASYLEKSFANKILGIDLPGEERGFVPTPSWKEKLKGEPWYTGDTYNISIGQGDLLVTPLWLSSYVTAIANGGTVYSPRVVSKILDQEKQILKEFPAEEIGKLPFSENYINEMKVNMRETVLSGTAQILKDIPASVAAKTGTAEVIKGKTVNALFISFAPLDQPEIAVTILVEGSSSNQGYAVRAANLIYRWYFGDTHK